jgi:hypothetical protein
VKFRGRATPTAPTDPAPHTVPVAVAAPVDLHIRPGGRRLGELLVDARMATREQVMEALERAARGAAPVGRVLVKHGVISEQDLARVVAVQHGWPWSTCAR